MHLKYRNAETSFEALVGLVATESIDLVRRPSRAGDVIQIVDPMTITYEKPLERVILNTARDCNPFFHLYESLWMLAGRNDVAPLHYFNSKIAEIASDNGWTFNGAYGYRWREAPVYHPDCDPDTGDYWSEVDQLTYLANHIAKQPTTRRAVLAMWNVQDDLLKIEDGPDVECGPCDGTGTTPGTESIYCKHCSGTGIAFKGKPATKDVCCNTQVYFLMRETPTGYALDMTVSNRSNDLVWGMLGANVVHFSYLQQYMARAIEARMCKKVEVGVYHQFTNNLHVYEDNWKPEKWLSAAHNRDMHSPPRIYETGGWAHYNTHGRIDLVSDPERFDDEVKMFINNPDLAFKEAYLERVAKPVVLAFRLHKDRRYSDALNMCTKILEPDWELACRLWITRRRDAYNRRSVTDL